MNNVVPLLPWGVAVAAVSLCFGMFRFVLSKTSNKVGKELCKEKMNHTDTKIDNIDGKLDHVIGKVDKILDKLT